MIKSNIQLLLIVVILSITVTKLNSTQNEDVSSEKNKLIPSLQYAEFLSDLDKALDLENLNHEKFTGANDDDDPDVAEYKNFFRHNLPTEFDEQMYSGFDENINKNRIKKRFLGTILDIMKGNHKTTRSPTTGYLYPISDEKIRPKIENHSAFFDDAFYKLKMHCLKTYDSLCFEKKQEMKALVDKCDILTIKNRGVRPESCKDVLSVYCYIYYSKDTFTCFSADYEPYMPGQKFTKSSITTQSTRRISINIQTDPPIRTTTTTTKQYIRPVITTTKEYIKPTTTTTKEYVRPVTTTTKAITMPVVTTASTARPKIGSPFDGPVLTIPNDAEKLKEIGNYCLKTKEKEVNCEKMLKLLKDKFKTCEKKPKTDTDCQSFKFQFCSAYTNFPCCPDVLAGRACTNKSG